MYPVVFLVLLGGADLRYPTLEEQETGEQVMQCDQCAGTVFTKAGKDRADRQQYRCRACRHRLTQRTASAFCGFQFPDDVIALAVRW